MSSKVLWSEGAFVDVDLVLAMCCSLFYEMRGCGARRK